MLFWTYGWLNIRVAWANEQTKIFDATRTQALQSDPAHAAGCLDYVVGYYPSGSKQVTGSRLDQMVERDPSLAARDIIAYLRDMTDEDLETSPEAWIQKYGKN